MSEDQGVMLCFEPVGPDDPGYEAFTPDVSALAHYASYGPLSLDVVHADPEVIKRRRVALAALIDEAFGK